MSIPVIFFYSKKPSAKTFVERIADKHQKDFQNLSEDFSRSFEFHKEIETSINIKDFKTAYRLSNSLNMVNHADLIYLYNGMIMQQQDKYDTAIHYYTKAIEVNQFSKAIGKRAAIYEKLGKNELAIIDYKRRFEMNYDYSLSLATLYEKLQETDSAKKFFQIYLNYHPEHQEAKSKVE